jgi:methylenetetrahydrofolate reductase (NADPH)
MSTTTSSLVSHIRKNKTDRTNETISSCRSQHFSIEFFPPKTSAGEQAFTSIYQKLATLNPDYFSVTYGAGGSTKERTFRTIQQLALNSTIPATPHISSIGETIDDITNLLNDYRKLGINRLVVLRGDLPSGVGPVHSDFKFARDLVRFIRETTGDYFNIAVAAYPEIHPQAHSYEEDLKYFCDKVREGADSAITQFFFNADSYFYFVDRCEQAGIDIPIIPGIMPIYNRENLIRFADGCGAEIPRWIRLKLECCNNEADLISFGEDLVVRMCDRLLENGAPGLHFYSLNRTELITRIWKRLS